MIKLEKINVSFDEKTVLRNFSLYLPTNGITCLSGPSGSGKTTLLRVLAGLQTYSGSISNLPSKIAFMFQEDRLIPWLDAISNVRLVMPKSHASKAEEWLNRVGLGNELHRYPSELSGGMCRRVAFARALAYDADMLLLDEPFKGTDAELTASLTQILLELDIPIIVSTHAETEIQLLGGNVIRLSGPPLTIL